MTENISETMKAIRKDFEHIDQDEYAEMLSDTINEGFYHTVFIGVTDIMMCFEKYMMETTHRFPFMNEDEKQRVLINTIKEHLVPSSPLENIQKTIVPLNAVKNPSIP